MILDTRELVLFVSFRYRSPRSLTSLFAIAIGKSPLSTLSFNFRFSRNNTYHNERLTHMYWPEKKFYRSKFIPSTTSLPWVPQVFSRVRRGTWSAVGRHVRHERQLKLLAQSALIYRVRWTLTLICQSNRWSQD